MMRLAIASDLHAEFSGRRLIILTPMVVDL